MRLFLSYNDFDVWKITLSGHQDPSTTRDSWSEQENGQTKTAKAVNTLYCAPNVTEYKIVSLYPIVKEIWLLLEVTHESTSQVKKFKISILS